jgi:hypothetical protein
MVGDRAGPLLSPPSIDPTEGTPIIDANQPSPVAPASSRPDRRRGRPPGHIEQFGEGRVCGSPGCATILSRYNRDLICGGHVRSTEAARDATPR